VSGTIRVPLQALKDLSTASRELSDRLEDDRTQQIDFTESQDVWSAYTEFLGRWQGTRKERVEALRSLSDTFAEIVITFEETETTLTSALDK
jgi:hypothetical protein